MALLQCLVELYVMSCLQTIVSSQGGRNAKKDKKEKKSSGEVASKEELEVPLQCRKCEHAANTLHQMRLHYASKHRLLVSCIVLQFAYLYYLWKDGRLLSLSPTFFYTDISVVVSVDDVIQSSI